MNKTNRKLKIRIFGAEGCNYCKRLCEEMSLIGVPFDFLDANHSSNTQICDKYNVDKLPHIQCYAEGEKDIICDHAGPISAQSFMNKVSEKITGKKGSVFQGKTKCKNCEKK